MATGEAGGRLQADRGRRRAGLRRQRGDRSRRVLVLVPDHRGARAADSTLALMGLLDYYRQFDDMSDAEASERLLRKRDQERAKALAQIPMIDLSGTEWPDFPN